MSTPEETAAVMLGGEAPGPAPAAKPPAEPSPFFDHPTSQPKQPAAQAEPAPSDEQSTGDVLFAVPEQPTVDVPEAIQKLRGEDSAGQMFDVGTNGDVDQLLVEVVPEQPAEVRKVVSLEYARMARDVGLSGNDMTEFTTLAKQLHAKPADENQVKEWGGYISERLATQYGHDAERVMADAIKLATRDPRVAHLLDVTGLGSHPQVVLKFCQRAVAMRGRI